MTDIRFKLNTGADIPALGLGKSSIKPCHGSENLGLIAEKEHGKALRDKCARL